MKVTSTVEFRMKAVLVAIFTEQSESKFSVYLGATYENFTKILKLIK